MLLHASFALDFCKGDFSCGLAHGWGCRESQTGLAVEGQFIAGVADGFARSLQHYTMHSSNRDTSKECFEGWMRRGTRHGHGREARVTQRGCISFEGQFDSCTGGQATHGRWAYPSGDTHVGAAQAGVPHGHGVASYGNGDKYIGMMASGKRHGYVHSPPHGHDGPLEGRLGAMGFSYRVVVGEFESCCVVAGSVRCFAAGTGGTSGAQAVCMKVTGGTAE